MKYSVKLLLLFFFTHALAIEENIIDELDDSEEEDDPYDRPLEAPDLSALGFESLGGDIIRPINETSPSLARKGLDFDSLLSSYLRWPDGVVSYSFSRGLTGRHRRVLRSAMKDYEENTCLKFKPAGTFQVLHYLNFRGDRSGCFSMVGRMQSILGQDLNLGPGCVSHHTALHEIGHAIGFFHEQSRSDRDQHIKILWDNVSANQANQFYMVSDNPKGVPYDSSSVMQYPEWAFQSDVEKNTIVTRDPFLQLSLGNSRLSFRDRKMANAMYDCDAKCPNRDDLKCENEGFIFQRSGETGNCSCVCPPYAVGIRCETRLDRSYYEYPKCGGNITTEGPIQTLNAPYTTFPDGGCVFWIQAPEGKYPQVRFSDFSFQGRRIMPRSPFSGLKCPRERVEIRTLNLYEGEMFCSNDLEGKNITSSTKDMIIVASPKYSGYPGGFRGTVHFVDQPKRNSSSESSSGFFTNIFG